MKFQLVNRSQHPYIGWHRTVVDPKAVEKVAAKEGRGIIFGTAHDNGQEARWCVGRMLAPNSRILDLQIKVAPGQAVTIDTDKFVAKEWDPDPLPLPLEKFGWPTLNGYPMQQIGDWWLDGACFCMRWGVRLPPSQLIAAFLVMRYPLGDTIATGTITVCASNPDVPDLQCPLPQLVLTGLGAWDTACPIDPGYIGDGQARHWPVCVDFTDDSDDPRRQVVLNRQIHGHGLTAIGHLWAIKGGMPEQMRFDPIYWRNLGDNVRRSTEGYGLAWPPVGVVANSGSTGDQEEQGYDQGFESFYVGGEGADVPRFWAALGQGRQPCHRLKQNGEMLMPEDLPNAMMWDSTWLWIQKSSDQGSWLLAGKPRQVNTQGQNDTQGWHGPDAQHVLENCITSAYELSGEECLLWELEHRARNFIWEDTVEPGLSTSGPNASRAFGWRGIEIANFLQLLPAGELRDRVLRRWIERVEKVYLPRWEHEKCWDIFGPAPPELAIARWFVYQQAVGAFGGYCGCIEALRHVTSEADKAILQRGVAMCVAGAESVMHYGYEIHTDQAQPGQAPPFKEWEMVGHAGGQPKDWRDAPYVEGQTAHRTGWYRHAWMPLSLWVVAVGSKNQNLKDCAISLRHTLMHELRANPNNRNLPDWFPPLP